MDGLFFLKELSSFPFLSFANHASMLPLSSHAKQNWKNNTCVEVDLT